MLNKSYFQTLLIFVLSCCGLSGGSYLDESRVSK